MESSQSIESSQSMEDIASVAGRVIRGAGDTGETMGVGGIQDIEREKG